MSEERWSVRSAAVVLPCPELTETLSFFIETLGFQLEMIQPADDPSVALLSGHGVRIRLERGRAGSAGVLSLACAGLGERQRVLIAPNGTRIELRAEGDEPELPPLETAFVLSRLEDARWVDGRAGMRYRDLVPQRQGGHFIASHIHIPDGGPVPDYVHHHRVRFQAIYVHRGWVRVAYADQGPPIVMQQGDCVLQPPTIRHRVLACSPGLEVVEVASPAAHATFADHELTLPTDRRERIYEGQRFIHHVAADAVAADGMRDTGIAEASGGVADVRVVRPGRDRSVDRDDAELLFFFVLSGRVDMTCEGVDDAQLATGDAVVIPARRPHALTAASEDASLLSVALLASDHAAQPGGGS